MAADTAAQADSSEPVLTGIEDGVMTVTLNRPDRMNALNHDLLAALARTWEYARDPEVRVVVVTGAGRGFCAGADVRSSTPENAQGAGLRTRFNPHVLGLASLPKPVIAAVNGAAAGAGLSLACAADIRVASTAAKFVPAFSRIGVAPDAGGTYFIPRLIGFSRALDWLATSDELSAERALEWGLVNEVVEPDVLMERTYEKARRMAEMPGEAVAITKALIARSWSSTLAEQLEHEADLQPFTLLSPGRAAARAAMVDRLGGKGAPNDDTKKG